VIELGFLLQAFLKFLMDLVFR